MLEFNYTILIQFLNFLILLILLNLLLFKPVLNALRKRKASIQSLSEMVSPDKSTYYQLWMNDHSELLWYAIPRDSYAANRDDWRLLK